MINDIETKEDSVRTNWILSWTVGNIYYEIFEYTCSDGQHEYNIYESEFEMIMEDGIRTKKFIDTRLKVLSSHELIEFLAKPTIVRISGYKGEIPESPFTVSIDGRNVETQICDNTFYSHYDIVKTSKNLIYRLFKTEDTRRDTIVVEHKKLNLMNV